MKKKVVKENDKGLNLTVSKPDYDKNELALDNAVGDDGSITIKNNLDGDGIFEDDTPEEEDTAEVDSLYSDADDRAVEYGVKTEANFDSLMEDLEKKGKVKIVNVAENVNPRIKKADLVEYLSRNIKK